jgi:REP-associated tyrosine transposase
MARPLRIAWEGAWYHITARGNERGLLFLDDEDRRHLLGLLGRMSDRYHILLHVYTLMDTHYHLVLETPEANLSAGMHWLNSGYGGWFNRRHRRTGHLLEGRFKGIIVEPPRWGLELSRYVHLNPIRIRPFALDKQARRRNRLGLGHEEDLEMWNARIDCLRDYPWSSYRAYIGLEKAPEWLHCETVLSWVGGPKENCEATYQRYVEEAAREGLPQTPWKQLEAQVVLGSAEFRQSLQRYLRGDPKEQPSLRALRTLPDFAQVVRIVESIKGEPWQDFSDRHGDWGRNLALTLAFRYGGLRLKQLGALAGGLDYVTVSGAIHRFEEKMETDQHLAEIFQSATSQLEIGKT